jgi:phosphoglycolate phosphatase
MTLATHDHLPPHVAPGAGPAEGYRLVVFDWDGTLIDSEARIVACMAAAIADVGLPQRPPAALRNVIGLGLREALTTLFPDGDPEAHQHLTERYRHHFLFANPTPSAPFPGSLATLEWLAGQGYHLAVATGKGRTGLDKALKETGFGRFFAATRSADETASKPDPLMLREIMAELEVPPSQTLMVGDTEYDLAMARNAGTDALGVSYGVHERRRLLALGPRALLDDIAELPAWLTTAGIPAG